MEQNETTEVGNTQFSANDLLKRKTVEMVFEACRLGSHKQETLAEFSYDSDFTNMVLFSKSALWKYTPMKLRSAIRAIYSKLDDDIKKMDERPLTELSDKNKMLSKQKIAYMAAVDVLEILLHVLQNSPLSIEFRDMEIADFDLLLKSIRTTDVIDLFGEINEPA